MSLLDSKHSDLKIQTPTFQQVNTFYPSPHSPSDDTCAEQVFSVLPQDTIHQDELSNKEWTMASTPLDHHPFCDANHFQRYFGETSEASVSSTSSLGVRTPDIGIFDIANNNNSPSFMLSHRPSFEYVSLLQQSPILSYSPPLSLDHASLMDDSVTSKNEPDNNHSFSSPSIYFPNYVNDDASGQLIPSLSNEDHMMLLQKSYSDHPGYFAAALQQQHYAHCHQTASLSQLSKEQLIERVVQLEMEKSSRSSNNMKLPPPACAMATTTRTVSNVQPSVSRVSSIAIAKPIVTEHDDKSTKMYSCQWASCDAQAPTLDKLMTHICNSHIGSGKATYYCEWKDCPRNKKPFMKRHKMHNHMRTHTGERPFVCTVIGCNKTFSRPDSLSTHIKTHSDSRPYLCSMPGCDKAYYHSRSLRKHIKSSHMKNSKTTHATSKTITHSTPSNTISSAASSSSSARNISTVTQQQYHHHLQNRINIMKKRQHQHGQTFPIEKKNARSLLLEHDTEANKQKNAYLL
ncbi:hypothetical protein RMATCC62417_08355 [Rhizopus microsporus]|nr:hypothetical protein RMATCC62417_08355 [Rhizopus microsporus]